METDRTITAGLRRKCLAAAVLGAAALAYIGWSRNDDETFATTATRPRFSPPSAPNVRNLAAPRTREYRLTEDMNQLAIGLDSLFQPGDLVFHGRGLDAQIRESLASYDTDWVLSLAKLEKALKQLDAENAPGAFALIRDLLPPDDLSNGKAYRILFRAWSRADGPGALSAAVESLPANDIRLFAGEETLGIWAERDPLAAASAAAGLPDTYGKDYLIYTIPYTYGRKDPIQAITWADSLPENYTRGALQHCMLQWLEQDPRGAAGHALARAKSGGGIDSKNDIIIIEVAEYLASQSHDEAMRWLEQMPGTSPAYYKGLETVMEFWAESEPREAGEWLKRNSKVPQMDPVIDRYARTLAFTDPLQALQWSRSIQAPGLRVMSVRAILDSWFARAPDQARKWASDNGYSLAANR